MKKRLSLLLIVCCLYFTTSYAFDFTLNFDYSNVSINNLEYKGISREKTRAQVKSRCTTEKKLAVEGRIWWYKSSRRVIPESQEYGIRIGEEVTINEEKWNKVSVCMFTEPHALEVETSVVPDTILIGYIKDDGRNVSSIAVYNSKIPTALDAYMIFSQDFEYPTNLYTFGQIGERGTYGAQMNI